MARAEGASQRFYDDSNWLPYYRYSESMPHGFERDLRTLALSIWLHIRKLADCVPDESDEHNHIAKELASWLTEFRETFSDYRNKWETEDSASNIDVIIKLDQMSELMKEINSTEDLKESVKLWNKLSDLCRATLKSEVKFDFLRFKILHGLNVEHGGALEGKNVVLLLGRTGAGKSTFTLYICGKKLVLEDRGGYKSWYLERSEEEGMTARKGDSLKSVKIANQRGESETRFLSPVQVKYKSVFRGKGPKYLQKKDFYICDAAGFADTQGPEVDCASICGTVSAAKTAKTVIPLIFISSADGNHLENARQFLRSLSSVFTNLADLAERRLFGYVFTRFQDSPGNIRRIFQDMCDSMSEQEKSDVGFKTLVETLQDLTEHKDGSDDDDDDDDDEIGPGEEMDFNPNTEYEDEIFVFNPADSSNSKKSKTDLKRIMSIPTEDQMNPEEDFSLTIPVDVRKCVEDGIRQRQRKIQTAILGGDLKSACFFLEEICEFVEIFEDQTLHNTLDRLKKELGALLTKVCCQTTNDLALKVETEDYALISSDYLETIYKEACLMNTDWFLKLKSLIGQEHCNLSSETVSNKVIRCVEVLITSLATLKLESEPRCFTNVLQSLSAFKSVFKAQDDVQSQVSDAFKSVIQRLMDWSSLAQENVQQEKFNDAGHVLTHLHHHASKLNEVYPLYHETVDAHEQLNQYPLSIFENRLAGIKDWIETLADNALDVFGKRADNPKKLTDEETKAVQDSLTTLNKLSSSSKLLVHLPDGIVNEKLSSIVENANDVFEKHVETFNRKLETLEPEGFAKLHGIYECMKQIIKIDTLIQERTHTSMSNFVSSVVDAVTKMQKLILRISALLFSDTSTSHSETESVETSEITEAEAQKFPKIIEALTVSTWIDELKPGLLADNLDNLDKEIKFAAKKLNIRFQQMSFTSPEDIAPTARILSAFDILQYVEGNLPGIKAPREETEKTFNERLQQFLSSCQDSGTGPMRQASDEQEVDLFFDVPHVINLIEMAREAQTQSLREPKDMKYKQIHEMLIKSSKDTYERSVDLIVEKLAQLEEHFENPDDKAALSSWVLEIHRAFSLVATFRETDQFKSFTNAKYRELEEKLNSTHMNLSSALSTAQASQQSVTLERKVKLSELLSRFDSNIHDESMKFTPLHRQYAPSLSTVRGAQDTKFNAAVNGETLDVNTLCQLWTEVDMTPNSFYRRQVMSRIEQLAETAYFNLQKIPKQLKSTEKLVSCYTTQISKLSQFKERLHSKLTEEEKAHFDSLWDRIKKILERKLSDCIRYVRLKFDSDMFSEAETLLENVRQAANIVDNITSNEIQEKLEQFETHQTERLTKVVDAYKTMELSSYMFDPPKKLHDELDKGQESNAAYRQSLRDLQRHVLSTFKRQLTLREDGPATKKEKSRIEDAERAVEYLHESMQGTIRTFIAAAQNTLSDRGNRFSHDVDVIFGSVEEPFDITRVTELLKAATDPSQRQEIAKNINEHLKAVFESLKVRLNVENVKFLIQCDRSKLPQASTYVKRLCAVVKDTFQISLARCQQRSDNLKNAMPSTPGRSHDNFNKHYELLLRCIKVAELEGLSEFGVNSHEMKTDVRKVTQELKESMLLLQNAVITKAESLALTKSEAEEFLTILNQNQDIFDALKDPALRSFQSITSEILKFCSDVSDACDNVANGVKDINSDKRGREYFGSLKQGLAFLKEMSRVDDAKLGFVVQPSRLAGAEKAVSDYAKGVFQELTDILKDAHSLRTEEMGQINTLYKILEYYCEAELPNYKAVSPATLKRSVAQTVFKSFGEFLDADVNTLDMQQVAVKLTQVQRLSLKLSFMKESIRNKVDTFLKGLKEAKGMNCLEDLALKLQKTNTPEGMEIISSYSSMKAILREILGRKLKTHGIDYVMDRIRGDGIDKSKLGKKFKEYEKCYEKHLSYSLACKTQEIAMHDLAEQAINLSSSRKVKDNKWTSSIKGDIPELLALLSVMWTVNSAEDYFQTTGGDERRYLLQPHPAQIITLFRLLCLDVKSSAMDKQLVQVGTGEGKSLILGLLSAVFGLYQYEVSCACYSHYLSSRDYEAFAFMFDALKINTHVHYGTFKDLCERAINKYGNVRDIVRSKLLGQPLPANQSNSGQRQSVLLIDEVDVFFKPDFYGQVYIPKCSVPHPTLIPLIEKIWENSGRLSFDTVKGWQEYTDVLNAFSEWPSIVEESVKSMVLDSKPDPSHLYEVDNGKIGYKEHDGIVFNLVYGYKTMFAWLKERDAGKVKNEDCQEQMTIKLDCGTFSFAEIPKTFDCLLGVSGTLEQLSNPEKGVIDEYGIKKQTLMPSVFGDNKRQFATNADVHVEGDDDYYVTLAHEIESMLKLDRSALVFFKNRRELDECRQHPNFQNLITEQIPILDEYVNESEKQDYVTNATRCGALLFATRPFGRGTDFKIYDKQLEQNGGCHVIQTFLSEEAAEETQIMGRSARQGDKGSYCLIVKESDLEQFLITADEIKQAKADKKVYDLLREKRDEKFKQFYETATSQVEETREEHEKAVELRRALLDGNKKTIENLLGIYNKAAGEAVNSRTLVLMDATGSMHNLMAKAKATAKRTFERAADILTEHNVPPDCFSVQFAVYRNYNAEHDTLFHCSPWVQNPNDLVQFLNSQDAMYGWGNEAVEVGLQHAVRESNSDGGLSQVIIIGDAPAHTESEVTDRRARHGEAYWQKDTRFATPTHWRTEITQLTQANVPVYCFYVRDRAKSNFDEMAALGNGKSAELDVNSSEGERLLTDQVTMLVLQSLDSAGGNLVESYKRKYMAGYQ